MSAGISPSVLERPQGGFAMVALDQRESMRDLLVNGSTDDDMRAFKREAAAALAPVASAVLLDRHFGLAEQPAGWVATTPLILAADHFEQPSGQPVISSTLDPGVTKDFIQVSRASALKFLALWNADDDSAERADLVSSFIELAHSAGVPAVVEGIVRHSAGSWSSVAARDDAIVAAAAELSALGADLYKAEVPGDPMHLETIEEGAKRITEAVPCAWVVLSNGVPPDVFADAVEAACAGGASGFLAGRAIWTSAARSADPSEALGSDSVARFRAVDERVPARSPATR